MTYEGRPVFDYVIDAKAWPDQSLSFDIGEIDPGGWGNIASAITQRRVTNSWPNVSVHLTKPAQINSFDTFVAGVGGRLAGFWLPIPRGFAVPVAYTYGGGEANDIIVKGMGLADNWNTTWGQLHLWLQPPDGSTPTAVRVVAVAAASGGNERITLSAPRPAGFNPSWAVQRLAYVRFGTDREEYQWIAEGHQRRTCSFVELPMEYGAYETGLLDVYLYRFYLGSPQAAVDPVNDWFFTSWPGNLASTYNGTIPGQVHDAIAINHGALSQSIRAVWANKLEIETVREPGYPWERFIPSRVGLPLFVQLRTASLSSPNTTSLLFTGRVNNVFPQGKRVSIECRHPFLLGRMKAPTHNMGSECDYEVFDASTCGLAVGSHQVTATAAAVNGAAVTLTAAGFSGKPVGWYARGLVQIGSGRTYDAVSVVRSDAASGSNINLILARSLMGLTVGSTVTVLPGCDGSRDRCTVLGNYPNFGGKPKVPEDNPSVKPLPDTDNNGNKK